MNPQGHSPALPRGGLSLTTTTVNEPEVLAREPCSMFIILPLGSSKRNHISTILSFNCSLHNYPRPSGS